MIIFYSILTTLISYVVSSKILKGSYVVFGDSIVMLVRLQETETSIIITPNLESDFNFISDIAFHPITPSKENRTIILNDMPYNAERHKVTLLSNDINITNFDFFFLSNATRFITGDNLGLAYESRYSDMSLIQSMKAQGLIDKLQFGFSKKLIDDNGVIYFGGIDDSILRLYEHASCKINEHSTFWGCNLRYIYLDGNATIGYVVKGESHFSSSTEKIFVPSSFFDFLKKKYFDSLIERNECSYEGNTNKKELCCKCNQVNDLLKITFVIDSIAFTFDSRHLFDKLFDYCYFIIKADDKKTNNGQNWILGSRFYSRYYTFFDYEDKSVNFYQDEDFDYVDINKFLENQTNIYKVYMIITICLVSSIALIINIITKIKYRNII